MSDSVKPHRQQPTRLPRSWASPGKNTGVGCHFLLQCRKVKSESEVAQSCLTLCNPMDCSLPGSSVHGVFQARVLEWSAIAFSDRDIQFIINKPGPPCMIPSTTTHRLLVNLEKTGPSALKVDYPTPLICCFMRNSCRHTVLSICEEHSVQSVNI